MDLLKIQTIEYKEKNERSAKWIAERAGIPVRSMQRYLQNEKYQLNETNTKKLREFLNLNKED